MSRKVSILAGLAAAAVAGTLVFRFGFSSKNDDATNGSDRPANGATVMAGEPPFDIRSRDGLELDIKSDFSHIKVRKELHVRTLYFVRDNGEKVVESQLNLSKPHEMLVTYTRFMFLSYLFKRKQEKVLIIGLGGGSMIHFMKHHDPEVKIDAVEIDPIVVRIADKYFGVRSEGNVKIHTADGFKFLREVQASYDVIYMDAFLKPSDETDMTGVPLRLKTIRFYQDIQKKLSADGMVVFNINPHDKIMEDVRTIRDAFPQTYVFKMPNDQGLVVVGSMNSQRARPSDLMTAAAEIDGRFKTTYSFRNMSRTLER